MSSKKLYRKLIEHVFNAVLLYCTVSSTTSSIIPFIPCRYFLIITTVVFNLKISLNPVQEAELWPIKIRMLHSCTSPFSSNAVVVTFNPHKQWNRVIMVRYGRAVKYCRHRHNITETAQVQTHQPSTGQVYTHTLIDKYSKYSDSSATYIHTHKRILLQIKHTHAEIHCSLLI